MLGKRENEGKKLKRSKTKERRKQRGFNEERKARQK